eukprot:6587259-Prymnesium_polylepis.1
MPDPPFQCDTSAGSFRERSCDSTRQSTCAPAVHHVWTTATWSQPVHSTFTLTVNDGRDLVGPFASSDKDSPMREYGLYSYSRALHGSRAVATHSIAETREQSARREIVPRETLKRM